MVAADDGGLDPAAALLSNAKVVRTNVTASRLSARSSDDCSCCLSDMTKMYFWTLDDYEKVCELNVNATVAWEQRTKAID